MTAQACFIYYVLNSNMQLLVIFFKLSLFTKQSTCASVNKREGITPL